jgi:hypothetical protein
MLVLELASAMRNLSTFLLILCMLHLAAMPAMAEEKRLAAGKAAGAAATAPLAPGRPAGTAKAQATPQAGGLLIVGLGGLVIAGAVLVVSGSGGDKSGGASPQNFSMPTTGTAP